MYTDQIMNDQGRAIIIVSAVFTALAVLAVWLRVYVRLKNATGLYLDDWLIVLGLILTLGVTVNNIVGVIVAGIGDDEYYRTDPAAPGFPFPKELKPQGQVMFALQILHTCAMPVIKASILAFYWRIFNDRKGFRVAVCCVAAYVFCWWIAILFSTIFQCKPISYNWGTEPTQLGGCLPDIPKMYETAALTNVLSDVAILFLPTLIVWKMHLLQKHKFAVLLIFLTGAVVVVAGIGRTAAYFSFRHLADYNFSSDYYPLVIWTSLEPTLGVVGACLPTIRPLFQGLSPEIVVNSVRSAISLRSFRNGSNGSATGGSKNAKPAAGDANGGAAAGRKESADTESTKGFWELGERPARASMPSVPERGSVPRNPDVAYVDLDEHPAFGDPVDTDVESGLKVGITVEEVVNHAH